MDLYTLDRPLGAFYAECLKTGLPYHQSVEENAEVERHPTQREADADVDHRLHDVDVCARQSV